MESSFTSEEVFTGAKTSFQKGEFAAIPKRGITIETCKKYGYTIGTLNGRTVQAAPYYASRRLVAHHTRDADKNFAWVGKPQGIELFGQHLWARGGKRVVITEGEIDCMTFAQCQDLKWPVVSLPSGIQSAVKYIKHNLDWLESFTEVVLAFDDDEPGRKGVSDVAPLFTPGKVRIARYDGYKDVNELYVEKCFAQAPVLQCIYQAQTYRPDGILNGAELWEALLEENPEGLSTPYPELDKFTHGIRPGELVMFTAGSGIGKSTAVNEIAYHLGQKHGKSIGIIALEESKKRTAERYLGIHLSKPLHISRKGVSKEQLEEAFHATIGNGKYWVYDHFGSLDSENLLAKIRYMVVGCGCEFIVLDHISIVVSGMDEGEESERKTIDKLMTKLRSLVQETGVGILAVAHLKRPGQGKSYNEGRQVSLTDLRGSAAIEQLSDIVISLERDQQGSTQNTSTMRVLKNRPIGKTGVCGQLVYDESTGRLLPMDGEGAFVSTGPAVNTDF